jgi:O-antigen ligase
MTSSNINTPSNINNKFIIINICFILFIAMVAVVSGGKVEFRHIILGSYTLILVWATIFKIHLIIPLLLFMLPFDYYINISGFRFYATQIVLSVSSLTIFLKRAYNDRAIKISSQSRMIKYYKTLFTVWLIYLSVSILYSRSVSNGFVEMYKWFTFVSIVYLVTEIYQSQRELNLKVLTDIIITGGIIQSIVVFNQQYDILPIKLYISELAVFEDTGSNPIFRAGGTVGNSSVLAFWMVTPLLLAVNAVTQRRNIPSKMIYLGVSLVILYAFALTLSRMAWASFLIGAILIYLYHTISSGRIKLLRSLVVIIGTILMIYFGFQLIEILFQNINLSFFQLVEKRLYQNIYTYSNRISVWTDVIEAIRDAPIFGYGLGSSPSLLASSKVHAHNTFLQLWLELGVLGIVFIIIFIWGIILLTFQSVKYLSKMSDQKDYAIAYSIILIMYIIGTITEYIFYSYQVGFFIFFNLSVILILNDGVLRYDHMSIRK